jgi:hypothetical protein
MASPTMHVNGCLCMPGPVLPCHVLPSSSANAQGLHVSCSRAMSSRFHAHVSCPLLAHSCVYGGGGGMCAYARGGTAGRAARTGLAVGAAHYRTFDGYSFNYQMAGMCAPANTIPWLHPSIRPSVPSLTHCFRWPLRKYERQSVQFVPCYFHVPLRFDSSKIGCGLRMHASRNLRRRIHPLASHERRRVAKRTGLLPLPLSVQSCVSQCRAVCRSAGHCRAESTYGCANLRRPCCHMSTYIHTRAHAGATSTLEKAKQHQSRN